MAYAWSVVALVWFMCACVSLGGNIAGILALGGKKVDSTLVLLLILLARRIGCGVAFSLRLRQGSFGFVSGHFFSEWLSTFAWCGALNAKSGSLVQRDSLHNMNGPLAGGIRLNVIIGRP